MSREDATLNGDVNGAAGARLRRPPLERDEPRRGWGNLYTPGKAYAAPVTEKADSSAHPAPTSGATVDAAARVVRDGYRIVEENLRRGRQVAAELRGVQREVAGFAGRLDATGVLGSLAQTLVDPALTEQLAGAAKSFLGVLSAAVPVAPAAAPGASQAAPASEPVALHPQDRPGYVDSGARILKLRAVGPGEWLADVEIEGERRRVQMRAVDGEL